MFHECEAKINYSMDIFIKINTSVLKTVSIDFLSENNSVLSKYC
jgi:hypothetical protein